jgi:hypothetical protein
LYYTYGILKERGVLNEKFDFFITLSFISLSSIYSQFPGIEWITFSEEFPMMYVMRFWKLLRGITWPPVSIPGEIHCGQKFMREREKKQLFKICEDQE